MMGGQIDRVFGGGDVNIWIFDVLDNDIEIIFDGKWC
jgi:hypothetical protein